MGSWPAQGDPLFSDDDLLCPGRRGNYRLMSALFLLVGVLGTATMRSALGNGFDIAYLVPLASIAAGVFMAFVRSGTTVDLDARTVTEWFGVGSLDMHEEASLDDVDAVRLLVSDRGMSTGRYRVYVVQLVGTRLEDPLWMGQSIIRAHAAARAQALATLLALPLREGRGDGE